MSIAHILILSVFICLGSAGLASIQSAFAAMYRTYVGKRHHEKAFRLKRNTNVCTAENKKLYQ